VTESLRPGEVGQCRALARAFLFRFFENEITAGSSDLRSSFFWLLSILVPPGMFLQVMALMKWSLANFVYGAEGVRRVAWMDKTMYIGFSMIAAGAVGTIVWNALVVDRRDTLVLGVQPLRGRTIVIAKLLALGTRAIFIGGMHTISSFEYGMLLEISAMCRSRCAASSRTSSPRRSDRRSSSSACAPSRACCSRRSGRGSSRGSRPSCNCCWP
jgi:hypothetical protein